MATIFMCLGEMLIFFALVNLFFFRLFLKIVNFLKNICLLPLYVVLLFLHCLAILEPH